MAWKEQNKFLFSPLLKSANFAVFYFLFLNFTSKNIYIDILTEHALQKNYQLSTILNNLRIIQYTHYHIC